MKNKYDLKKMNSIMEYYTGSIEDKNALKANLELLVTWNEWTQNKKLMGKQPTIEEIIKLPKLSFKNISRLPLFLYFVLSHMRVSCLDLTESGISDFTELNELRRIFSENGMDFYETVQLSHESKISLIKGDLAHQTLPENIAIYQIISTALEEKNSELFFRELLVSSLPDCIQLLPITYITIESCKNLSDLSLLSKCRELRSLRVVSCDKLTSLSGLAEPCSVTYHEVEDYKHLIDLPGDEGYPNLAGRRFVSLDDPVLIYAFKKRSNLQRVSINRCKNLMDISSLAACIELLELQISDCNNINDISFLNECTMSPDVYIDNCNNINESQLEPLKIRCQKIKSGIDYYENCTEKEKEEIDEIANKIRYAVEYQERILPRLEKEQAIGFSEPCPDGTTELYVSFNNQLTNLEGLQENHNIRTLTLENLEQLKTLKGVNKLPHLNELCIHNLKNLTSLEGLESLHELCRLDLSCFNQLKSWKELGDLPSLKQLFIHDGQGSISTLEGVEQASSIELIGLGDLSATTNLQALEQLPKLETVVLFPKHTGVNEFSIDDGLLNNLKHLALPAGVKLLQQCHGNLVEGGEDPYFLELGSFHNQNTLASTMASMTEPELDGSSGTLFVANQERPLPTISLESLEAQFG